MPPRAFVSVDLDAILHNIETIVAHTGRPIIAVVKADAYGHGLRRVARHISDRVLMLAVATLEEAMEVGSGRVLIFQPLFSPEEVEEASIRGFAFNLSSFEQLEVIRKVGRRVRVHMEVDTGMGRTGIWYEEFPGLYMEALSLSEEGLLEVEGVFTHFSSADVLEDGFTEVQVSRFEEALKKAGVDNVLIHAANTSATLRYPFTYYDAVRVGIGLYGIVPSDFLRNRLDLSPAMSFRARVVQKRILKNGESTGYGRTFVADRDMEVAVVGVGYADGYPWEGSNSLRVYARGRYRKVLGRVSMDLIVIEGDGLEVGDEVELWGEHVRVEDVASAIGKIPYDLLVGVGRRVERMYTYSERMNRST